MAKQRIPPRNVIAPITEISAQRVLNMTESDINTDPRYTLPNARIRLLRASSGNSSLSASVEQAISLANQGIVGLVGEYTSDTSTPVALALNSFKVYQCTVASTPALSDKQTFKYFFRTIPSDAEQARALAMLVRTRGWTKVGLITVNSPYASASNITILRNEAYSPDYNTADPDVFRPQVTSLRAADARVILILGFDADAIRILREARRQNLVSPSHVWIGSDGVETAHALLTGADTRADYTDEDRENVEGMVFTSPFENGGGVEKSELDARYAAAYGGASIMTYSYFYRDCLLTMALGIRRLLTQGVSLERVLNRTDNPGVANFVSFTFAGASGNVAFDSNADRTLGFQVTNIVRGALETAAIVSANGSITSLKPLVYKGGSTTAPADGVILFRDLVDLTSPLGLTLVAISALGIVLTFASVVVLVAKRATAPVKAMSLPFLSIAAAGIVIEFASVLGWIGRFEESGGVICSLQQWTGWIGFSLLMQGILPKCYRIYCIFENHRMYSATHLRDKYLLLMSTPITLINVLILAVWQSLDPLKPVRIDELSAARFHFECQSSSSSLQRGFTLTLMVYNGFLLLLAIVLAYATRNAASAYRETAYILYAAQNILICAVVVVAIVFSGAAGFSAAVALRVAMTQFAGLFALAVLLGRIAGAAVWGAKKEEGLGDYKGRVVKMKGGHMGMEEERTHTTSIPVGIISGTSDAGSDTFVTNGGGIVEFVIPVRDGGKTFALWERRKVLYSTSTKLLAIVHETTGQGESLLLSPAASLIPSKLPDCLEVRLGNAFKILQFGNARSLERFVEMTLPAIKGLSVGSNNRNTNLGNGGFGSNQVTSAAVVAAPARTGYPAAYGFGREDSGGGLDVSPGVPGNAVTMAPQDSWTL
ncbi:hypothetical protein HDU96_001770 [Phlyctochytrium bullatum]|nr:hypothetical protein HDU96_001770 [Phlyctochytrium bullatum]